VKTAGLLLCVVFLTLAACGKVALKDGDYEGASGADDTGAWGEMSVTIRDGRVAACAFITRQKDGTVKDDDYGKINGEISNADYYEKAQLAVRAMVRYAKQFAGTGSLDKVEAVSGATISYNQFLDAAEKALEKARN
jgi:major membrane immunogen (membrane-anchored lipoprotein)